MALRVLLADNSESIRRVIQLALQDFGVEVKTIGSAPDVLEIARSWKPDVILVDILLQKQNGYAVAQTIKEDPELAVLPVVLMWSGFMDFDEAKAKATRAEGRLEKPFDSEGLRAVILQMVPRLRQHPLSQFITPSKFAKTATQNSVPADSSPTQPVPPHAIPPAIPPSPRTPPLPPSMAQHITPAPRLAQVPDHAPDSFAPPSPKRSGLPPPEIPLENREDLGSESDHATQVTGQRFAPASASPTRESLTPEPLAPLTSDRSWNMESFDPVPPLEISLPELELDKPLSASLPEPGDDNFFPDISEVTQHSGKFDRSDSTMRNNEANFANTNVSRVNIQSGEAGYVDPLDGDEPDEFARVPLAPLQNLEKRSTGFEAPDTPLAGQSDELSAFGGSEGADAEGDWQRQDIQSFQLDIPAGADDGQVILDPELSRGGPAFYEKTKVEVPDAPFSAHAIELDEHMATVVVPKPKSSARSPIPEQLSETSSSQVTLQGAAEGVFAPIVVPQTKELDRPIHPLPSEPEPAAPAGVAPRQPVTRSAATIHPSLRPQAAPPPITPGASGVRGSHDLSHPAIPKPATVTPPQPPASATPRSSATKSAVTIDENSAAQFTAGGSVSGVKTNAIPSAATPAAATTLPPVMPPALQQLQAHQVEEFLRVQGQDIIREIANRVIPEIATQLIRQEIQRLLDDSISS